MTPRRLLVVQSIGPLRVVMGHTLDALRSRNSTSLGPGASMRSAKRLDAGSCALKKQPNVSGCLGWFPRNSGALRSEITDEILSGYALHLKIPLVVAH